jgi:DNA-binding transcriptional regulator GbsR (MarR family)
MGPEGPESPRTPAFRRRNGVESGAVRERIVGGLSRLLRSLGTKDAYARVYSALALSARGLTARELARRTRYSLGSLSLHLGGLERSGLVSRVRRGRTYVFRSESDLVARYRERISEMLRSELLPLRGDLEDAIRRLRSGRERDPEGGLLRSLQELRDRVADAETYLRKLLDVEPARP